MFDNLTDESHDDGIVLLSHGAKERPRKVSMKSIVKLNKTSDLLFAVHTPQKIFATVSFKS